MRILLVEDDPRLGEALVGRLRGQRHSVDLFTTLGDAEAAWRIAPYDLVVLDLMLPDGDGRTLVKSMRAAGLTAPVLMLTARDEIGDRVAGLDAGADDYLVKPFAMEELLARMRALVRRPVGIVAPILVFGNLRFSPAEGAAWVGQRRIVLTAQETSALERLMRSLGRVLPKAALGEHLYAFNQDWSDNAVETIVHRLRKKLAAADADVEVRAVRGLGYLFCHRAA